MYKAIKILFVIFFLSISSSGNSQADPEWLEAWNLAYKEKPANISCSSRIAAKGEPGTPMIIKGKIVNPDTSIASGVIVYAYHRDIQGFDFGENDAETKIWRLNGWAKTDANGNFEFQTIRPAADHLGREAAHIHITTISESFGRQWAPTVYLADDPKVTEAQHLRSQKAGQFAWVCETKESDGIQYLSVNIKLKEEGDF